MTDLSHSREKDKINPVVFYTSAGLILLFSLTTILFRDFSALWIGRTLDWVSKTFGWYYLLAATLYIVFVVCIACSRFGSVKLGPEQSKPEFSLLSWAAMLFAAGIGIDLMFFSVAEPVTQYMQPPEEGQQLGHLDLLVHMGEEQNFVYQIWPQQYSVPGFTYRARSGKSTYYRLETFLLEGSQGNDLMDYSKEQVITDILDQYERHLNFIHLHREAPGHSVMFPDA